MLAEVDSRPQSEYVAPHGNTCGAVRPSAPGHLPNRTALDRYGSSYPDPANRQDFPRSACVAERPGTTPPRPSGESESTRRAACLRREPRRSSGAVMQPEGLAPAPARRLDGTQRQQPGADRDLRRNATLHRRRLPRLRLDPRRHGAGGVVGAGAGCDRGRRLARVRAAPQSARSKALRSQRMRMSCQKHIGRWHGGLEGRCRPSRHVRCHWRPSRARPDPRTRRRYVISPLPSGMVDARACTGGAAASALCCNTTPVPGHIAHAIERKR